MPTTVLSEQNIQKTATEKTLKKPPTSFFNSDHTLVSWWKYVLLLDCYCLPNTTAPYPPCSSLLLSCQILTEFFSLYILAPIPCVRPVFFRRPHSCTLSSLTHTCIESILNKHAAFRWGPNLHHPFSFWQSVFFTIFAVIYCRFTRTCWSFKSIVNCSQTFIASNLLRERKIKNPK